jgi:phage-related protein
MATKNLLVRGGADFSGMKKAMENTQKSIQSFKESVRSSMQSINIALAGLGAGLGIGAAVKDAMTFQASIEQVNRLMGKSAGEFLKWATTSATAFNMSKKEAVQYGATFSNIISTFAATTQQTQQYTQDLLKATAVAASKTGRSMEDALERVRSGMLGNTEAIEDLGIFVNVAMIESTKAFQQFANGKSWDQLDFKVQQQIRLFAILEQASTKYGVEVGNNAVSATARFVAQLNNLKLAIGQAFLPIWETVLPSLTAFVGWLVKGMSVVAQFMQVLFGKEPAKAAQSQASANAQVASSVGSVGDAYKKAGKEAKKAAGSVSGFDEVNTLAEKTATGGETGGGDTGTGSQGGGVGGLVPEIPTETGGAVGAISEKVRNAAEAVKGFFNGIKDFFKGFGSFISEHKDIIIAALGGIAAGLLTYVIATKGAGAATLIWDGIAKASAAVMKGLRLAWAALAGPIGLIVLAVAAAVAAFIYFYRTNDTFKGFVDGILNKIKDAAIFLWKNALVPMGEYLATGFKAAWEGIKVSATWVWKNVFIPFGEYLKTFYKVVLIPLGNVLKDVLTVAFKALSEVAKSFWKNVMIPLGDYFKTNFKPTVEALSAVFKFLWENVLKPLGTFLGTTLLNQWKSYAKIVEFLWKEVLKPLVPFLKDSLNQAFKNIGETIGNLKTVMNGLMTFISGVFKGDWKKAWEGLKTIFKGVFDSLYDIVKRPLNLIIDAINAVISGLNKISFEIPDIPGVTGGGKKIGINIPKIPKLAQGGYIGANSPLLAMIGDNRNEGEIVAPESKIYEQTFNAIKDALSQMGGGNTGDIVLKLNEIELGRASAKSINKAQRTAGKLLLEI